MSKEGYKVFSSYIREDLLFKLKLLSANRGIPLYVLINEALSRYLDEIYNELGEVLSRYFEEFDEEGEFYEE